MKDPAKTADLEKPSYTGKTNLERVVHRAVTTMRPKRKRLRNGVKTTGRKKIVLPGFKQAYQHMRCEQREAEEEARLREKEEKDENEVSEDWSA